MAARKGSKPTAAKAAAKEKGRKPVKPASKEGRSPARKAPPSSAPYEQGKWAAAFRPRAAGERRYWLVKSEPESFSFDDLLAARDRTTCWDGVRNTAARNFLRDGMKRGDQVFFYHSMAEPSGVVGICEVVREGYPDHTAFDEAHQYYDAGSVRETPTWFMVDVRAVRALPRLVPLADIKAEKALAQMALVRVGRLSVVPVTPAEWERVLAMSAGAP
jgi:predicted RNA-binding protein with PUA-like domain